MVAVVALLHHVAAVILAEAAAHVHHIAVVAEVEVLPVHPAAVAAEEDK